MLYSLHIRYPYRKAQIEAWGGVVVQATPFFRYMIGYPLPMAFAHLRFLGWNWRVGRKRHTTLGGLDGTDKPAARTIAVYLQSIAESG